MKQSVTKDTTLLAFHGKQAVKDKYVARVKRHQDADEIVQGRYWEDGKGCAVGCTLEKGDGPHKYYETELGIPRTIAYLEDRIFEGLTNGEAKKFPLRFLEAITPGADLSLVVPKLMLWILSDKKSGVLQYAKTDRTKKAIGDVIALYERKLKGETITEIEWREAHAADAYAAYAYAAAADAYAAATATYAYAAATYAAATATYAYAAATATYAADATAAAADAAATYADAAATATYADAAAYADARHKRWYEIAEKFIELLGEAK